MHESRQGQGQSRWRYFIHLSGCCVASSFGVIVLEFVLRPKEGGGTTEAPILLAGNSTDVEGG
jgi:hypothetical protein